MEKKIILEILNETKIINSAAKAKNIDIVLSALRNRQLLYDEYEKLSDKEKKSLRKEMSGEIEKIGILDEASKKLLEEFDAKLRQKFTENSVQKSKLKKSNEVNKKYRNPYDMFTNGRFDAKF